MWSKERDRVEPRATKWSALGWLGLAPLLLLALLRLVAHDRTFELVALNSFSQWLYLPAWIVLVVAVYAKRGSLVVAAGTLALLQVWWIGPRGLVAAPLPEVPPSGARFRVMSVNLLGSNRDTEGIALEVLRARPDIVLLQEITPHWQARFEQPDLKQALPARSLITRTDFFGIGIYSRAPHVAAPLTIAGLPAFRADVPVAGSSVRVYNVHTMPPRTRSALPVWNEMMSQIVQLMGGERGPRLLGGDLNTTPHHAWFQRLLLTGLRGAHEDRGRALATTWPNGGLFPAPPIRLDHLFVSPQLLVLSVSEGEGRGSDHRPVIGDFAIAP